MSYGLEVKNQYGDVVIDGTLPLLNLVATKHVYAAGGTVTGPGTGEWHLAETVISLPHYGAPEVMPFIAISYGMEIGMTGFQRTDTHIEIGIAAKTGGYVTAELYSYNTFAISTQGNYGMQVFDGGGSLVFDSRNPPLRIRNFTQGAFDIALPQETGRPYGVSGDALLKYANVIVEERTSGQYHDFWEYEATGFLKWQNDRLIFDAPQYESMTTQELHDKYTFNYGDGVWGDPGGYMGGTTYNWHVLKGGPNTLGAAVNHSYYDATF